MRSRKKQVIFMISILLFTAILISNYIPAIIKQEILISAPSDKVINTALDISRWKYWHPLLKSSSDTGSIQISGNPVKEGGKISSPESVIRIDKASTYGIVVSEQNESRKARYSITVLSDFSDTVEVKFRQQVNLLTYISRNIRSLFKNDTINLLQHLKTYLETPELYYGYKISITYTEDPLVITSKKTTANNRITVTANELIEKLEGFIITNDLKKQQKPIANFTPEEGGLTTVMAGIAVDREVPATGEFFYQKMPRSRMVSGEYSGPFIKRDKVHKAIQKYINDHSLKPVALPFERYLNNNFTTNDSNPDVTIKVYYPVL